MAGRFLDHMGQGAYADRPLAVDMPTLVPSGAAAIYYSNDNYLLSIWDTDLADWFEIDVNALASLLFQNLPDVDWSTPPTDTQIFAWDVGLGKLIPVDQPANWTIEQIQDLVGAMLVGVSGITATYDDTLGELQFTVTVTQYTDEMAQDALAAAFAAGTHVGLTVSYVDGSNHFNIEIDDAYIEGIADAQIAAASIGDLNDVDLTGIIAGDSIVWNGTFFEAGASSSVNAIDDLSDVDTSTTPPVQGQGLVFDGTDWVPGSAAAEVWGQRYCGARINAGGASDQLISSTADTQVTNLDSAVGDSDGFTGVTADAIVIPAGMAAKLNAGRWGLRCGIACTASVAGGSGFAFSCRRNGTAIESFHHSIGSTGYTNPNVSGETKRNPVTLADGDILTLAVQSQDSSYSVLGNSRTYLELVVYSGPATAANVDFAYQPTSGNAFPGSPVSGQRFFRTDRGIEYYWDSTAVEWLSTQIFTEQIDISDGLVPFTATSSAHQGRAVNPFHTAYGQYLLHLAYYINHTGTGDWTVVVGDNGGTLATYANVTAQISGRTTLNISRTASQSGYYRYLVTENSGTANFYPLFAISYRLIG